MGYAPAAAEWPSPPLPPLAEWWQRVVAMLVDSLLSGGPSIVAMIVFIATLETREQAIEGSQATFTWFAPSPAGVITYLLASVAAIGISLWNRTFLQGRTGQSLGKRLMGIRLVADVGLQPIGPLNAFLRDLVHYLDGAAMYIGYLWPLWDGKRRTFADMIMKTVVIQSPK